MSLMDSASDCQNALHHPVAIEHNTPINMAIPKLLSPKHPTLQYEFGEVAFSTPALVVPEEGDAWAAAQKLAESAGMKLYINRLDVCTMRPIVTSADRIPSWHFIEGENSDFMQPVRKVQKPPNVVRVVGTNSSAGSGIFGEAADIDPKSPTYRYGLYGERVRTVKSERVTSSEQATAMAKGVLARMLGSTEEVSISAIPNPALDVGDTVWITRERLGLVEKPMIVVDIRMPLIPGQDMSVTLRRSVLTDEQLGMVQV
jgi:hypothetical protein